MNLMEKYLLRAIPREGEAGGGAAGQDGGGQGTGGGGGEAKPWFDGIEPEIIGHWDNKGWKKEDQKALVTEVTKAWRAAEKFVGAPADQILRLPKDSADEAGIKAMRARLGVPEDGKGYDFTSVKRADGSDLDPALSDTLRGVLHKAGVPKDAAPDAVKALVKHFDDQGAATGSAQAAKLLEEKGALQKDWGTNFEFNRLTAMTGARRLGLDPESVNALEGVAGYAKTMEALRRIGAGTTEDTFVDKGAGGSPVTAAGAVARKAELMADPAWAGRYLAGGAAEKREMDNLLLLISGAAA
jgi:hypothetical protein